MFWVSNSNQNVFYKFICTSTVSTYPPTSILCTRMHFEWFVTTCPLLPGHACSSLEAVNRIYDIKGRKHISPLAICVGDVSDIERYVVTDDLPCGLLDSLLPGPVTVVLRRGLLVIRYATMYIFFTKWQGWSKSIHYSPRYFHK